MTCIVGIVDGPKVWIGGDSAGSDGYNMVNRADGKVFKTGDFIFGFTTSYRMGQILRYGFTPPAHRRLEKDAMAYMVTDFIDGVRATLKSAGFAKKENEVEKGGEFLVGYGGHLYKIESDYQVAECADGYDACGCGERFALGSLFSTEKMIARARIRIALESAAHHSSGVRGPFHIEFT